MRCRFPLNDALDRIDMLAFTAAQFMVGAIALGEQPIHRNVIFRRARARHRWNDPAIAFLFDASQSRDFKATLFALFDACCLAVCRWISAVPHIKPSLSVCATL